MPPSFHRTFIPDTKLRFFSMSFVLIVSIGVTAKIASRIPAPIPARNCLPIVNLPLSSASSFLHHALPPKRMPAFGMEKNSVTPGKTFMRYFRPQQKGIHTKPIVQREKTCGAYRVHKSRPDPSEGKSIMSLTLLMVIRTERQLRKEVPEAEAASSCIPLATYMSNVDVKGYGSIFHIVK